MRASLTVEMVMLFPVVFLLLMMLIQTGLYVFCSIYETMLAERAVMVVRHALDEGKNSGEASALARTYLEDHTLNGAGITTSWTLTAEEGFFSDVYQADMSGTLDLLLPMKLSASAQTRYLPPSLFKARVDLIYEKGKQWLEYANGG